MQMNTKTSELSASLLDDIRENWLGDPLSSREDGDRRIRACQAVASVLGADMLRQLSQHEPVQFQDDARLKVLVLGYANGRAEAVLRESGESSRWAIELISLSALLVVLGEDWDEDALCGQGQKLWCQKHPSYLAGNRAAEADHGRVATGKVANGLAVCVADYNTARRVTAQSTHWPSYL